jgi:hypothetical protein
MHALSSVFFPKAIHTTKIATKEDAQKACRLFLLITEIAERALSAFVQKSYQKFDALVGETSCQIRAGRVQALAMQEGFVEKCANSLQVVRQLGETLRGVLPGLQAPVQPMVLDLFLQKLLAETAKNLQLRLSKDEQFLILSHALFLTRDKTTTSMTNESNLAGVLSEQEGAIDVGTCQLVVNKAKRELADASVQHVQALAKQEHAFFAKLIKTSTLSSCDLACTPCFFSIYLLLRKIMREGHLLLIKVKREEDTICVLLKSRDGKTFETQTIDAKNASLPAFVIEGHSSSHAADQNFFRTLCQEQDAIDAFPGSRILQVLLQNAAAHPQYAGTRKAASIPLFDKIAPAREALSKLKVDPMKVSVKEIDALLSSHVPMYDLACLKEAALPVSLAEVVQAKLQMDALAKQALVEGCAQENSSLFAIEHIRCVRVAEMLEGFELRQG